MSQPSAHQPTAAQPPYKQLRRPTTDRMVAGVASGLGRYFAVDPTLVRVIFACATVLTGGLALLAYPVMWFLMPEEPAGAAPWPHPTPAAPGYPAPDYRTAADQPGREHPYTAAGYPVVAEQSTVPGFTVPGYPGVTDQPTVPGAGERPAGSATAPPAG